MYAEDLSINFFGHKYLSHSAENFRRVTFVCCVSEKCRQQKVMDQRGVLIFSTESLLSHSTEKLRRGNT